LYAVSEQKENREREKTGRQKKKLNSSTTKKSSVANEKEKQKLSNILGFVF